MRSTVKYPPAVEEALAALRRYAYNDSNKLSEEEWKNDRRYGIGGSEVATIMGDSPFTSNIALFLDKTGIAPLDLSEHWFRLEYGHALEDLTAKLFARKMNAVIIHETGMFKHPAFDFIRANLDRLAILPNGELVILECKTSNPFARIAWSTAPPQYYQWQGRQYMAVLNAILEDAGVSLRISRVFYCCLYGNSEDDSVIRQIQFDEGLEKVMLAAEYDFWNYNIVPCILPEFNGKTTEYLDLSLSHRFEFARHKGVDDIKEEILVEGPIACLHANSIATLRAEENRIKEQMKQIAEQRAAFELTLLDMMEGAATAYLDDGRIITINSKESRSTNFKLLKELYPEAYANCVATNESKSSIKITYPKAKSKRKAKSEGVA